MTKDGNSGFYVECTATGGEILQAGANTYGQIRNYCHDIGTTGIGHTNRSEI